MLGELRTTALGPKNYYDLCEFFRSDFSALAAGSSGHPASADISVTGELRHIEDFFLSEHKRGRKMQAAHEGGSGPARTDLTYRSACCRRPARGPTW